MKFIGKVPRKIKFITCLAAILTVGFIIGYAVWQNSEEGNAMNLKGTIPPIDATAPANTETATFSLG